MVTVITGGRVYKAKILQDESLFYVHVFNDVDKMPMSGTTFSLNTNFMTDVLPWIKKQCGAK